MEHKQHLHELFDFLAPLRPMWAREVLQDYPCIPDIYHKDAVNFVASLSEDELFRWEGNHDETLWRNSPLEKFFERAMELTRVDSEDTCEIALSSDIFRHIKGKKEHEIRALVGLVSKLMKSKKIDHILDVGGGKGLLSQVLASELGVKIISIDESSYLQDLGARHAERAKGKKLEAVTFLRTRLDPDTNPDLSLPSSNILSLGLHTCGELAHAHFNLAIENSFPAVVNFGCCYPKISPSSLPLSQYAHPFALPWTVEGLTLATRSHAPITREDFFFKTRVKSYRYALHVLLFREYGMKDFVSLGNAPHSLYSKSFSEYATAQLETLSLKPINSLEDFMKQSATEVNELCAMNLIRSLLGRQLELHLLLDRAIFLEEAGYTCTLKEYFDEKISPRNIGLVALKK
jgi:hypothetical protein